MKVSVLQASLVANAVLLVAALVLGWRLAGAAPRCEAKQAADTGNANVQVRKDEGTRDKKLDGVTAATKTETLGAVRQTQEQTYGRAAAIDRVPVTGDCRSPVGLPDLGAAVDQANAAAGD